METHGQQGTIGYDPPSWFFYISEYTFIPEGKSKYGEFAEFTYRLCVTQEFVSQLLAMGDKVEVLEPEELREEMKKRITAMFNYYE